MQALKDGGASGADVAEAEAQAAVIATAVDTYEATFVSTGRTLAEIINLPAKIFTKMVWLHNMMEVTEGPITASMMEVYEQLNAARDEANATYRESTSTAMEALEAAVN